MSLLKQKNDVSDAFLVQAVAQGDLNTLRMALYQATRDPELTSMRVEQTPFWGGTYFVPTLGAEHAETVRAKAVEFLRAGAKNTAPAPSMKELRTMMEMAAGEKMSEEAFDLGLNSLTDDEFPMGVQWKKEPSKEVKNRYHVLIIGAGIGGLTTAVQLEQLGIPYTMIERNEGVGGTWWLNDYPEARVDVPSHHYQLSFMKKYPWKHWFAIQPELREYAETIAKKYNLMDKIRFGTELSDAAWDEASGKWKLSARGPDGREESFAANFVISAAGLFNAVNMPDIAGIETFKGKMFHTTQWDHSYDYTGKRIAQIGVGSTGAQLLRAIAERGSQVTVYQRSRHWVSKVEGYRDAIPANARWLLDNFPHYWNWYCFVLYYTNVGSDPEGIHNYDRAWQKAGGTISKRNDNMRKHNIDYITSKVGHRPDLIKKVIPDFPPFSKRPVIDNEWFDSLLRDNVELVTEGIEKITPTGIKTEDGVERSFDLILLCAGFKPDRYLWPVNYIGRDNITLEKAWEKDGARAYLGVTAPGFPNLFMLYGPNAQNRTGGIMLWLEIWARYSLKAIVEMIESGHTVMDIKRDVFEEYNARMDEKMKECIWKEVPSYYINKHGRQYLNLSFKPAEYYKWIREPNMKDFNIR